MADAERAPAAGAQEPEALERVDAVLQKAAVYYARQGMWDNEQDARSARTYLTTLAAPTPQVAEPSGVEREDEAWLEGEAEACDRAAATWGRKPVATRAEFVFRENAARYRRILARLRAGRDATPASDTP